MCRLLAETYERQGLLRGCIGDGERVCGCDDKCVCVGWVSAVTLEYTVHPHVSYLILCNCNTGLRLQTLPSCYLVTLSFSLFDITVSCDPMKRPDSYYAVLLLISVTSDCLRMS